MSEFKVGDKITTLACRDILTVTAIGRGRFIRAKGFNCYGMKDGECNVLDFQVKHATPEEIAAGHRIDEVVPVYANVKFPYNVLTGEQVGAVTNATHFGCDLGDDFPIENHISPNCKAKDA